MYAMAYSETLKGKYHIRYVGLDGDNTKINLKEIR
jgi:hypothetical protein